MKVYKADENYYAEKNTIVDVIKLSDYVDTSIYNLKNAWINVGGWQSWNPGFEIEPGKKQDSLTCHLIKGWNKYLVFPESTFRPSKNIVLGQFVTYLRWNNFYLVFVSAGNIESTLPPVQFVFNRKKNTVSVEIYDKGNQWNKDEITAKIEIFTAESFFECKTKLANLFGKSHFESIQHLGETPAGWESWYNHYSDINETLIVDNLKSLTETENIISKGNFTSRIFQIDDGWETALGDWTVRNDRFPNGLEPIVQQIEARDYIPGLWIAPFIIDARCKTAVEHPDWILTDSDNKKIISGFNPLWGEKGNFYCLDLSNKDVIDYLDTLMDTLINKWGFRYIKLDFLYAGMFYGNFKNSGPAYKHFTSAIKVLTKRKTANNGKKVAYLGCGVPFESAYKYLPLSRIGCDTLEHWENKKLRMINWNGRNEAYLNLKDTLGHSLWNKVIFANDPDVIFIREKNCSLSSKEKEIITFVNTIFGSQLMYSDDPTVRTSENETKLTESFIEIINKYQNESFGLKQIKKDVYEIFNETGNIKFLLNIGKERKLEQLN